MNNKLVEPKSLSGTMELLPQQQILFNKLKNTIENGFKSFGFLPLDTPIIERADVLLAKAGGETEKQIYNFNKGNNEICLRFDLTVPLAKYVAKNLNGLSFPFKRYQIGKVFRGEKAQKGRYREFYQCDVDTIGFETLSVKNDAEFPAIIYTIFKNLNLGDFVIMINNRKIISGLLEEYGLLNKKEDIMRLIDKFDKIGVNTFKDSLIDDVFVEPEIANKLINFISMKGDNNSQLQYLKNLNIKNSTFNLGVAELEEVVKYVRMQGVPENNFVIKLSIVRGLDYYTGTVFETILTEHSNLGSVCGGGRYDNLSGHYTEAKLPGVGIAIGLTRLFYQLYENEIINVDKHSTAKVLVLPMNEDATEKCFEIASYLRLYEINSQIYLEDKKFKNKLSYADKLSIPYVVIIGEDEIQNNYVTLKDMTNGTQEKIDLSLLINKIK